MKQIFTANFEQIPSKLVVYKSKNGNSTKTPEKAFQSQVFSEKFISTTIQTPKTSFNSSIATNQLVPSVVDLMLVENFVNNFDTIYNNKLVGAIAYYAW